MAQRIPSRSSRLTNWSGFAFFVILFLISALFFLSFSFVSAQGLLPSCVKSSTPDCTVCDLLKTGENVINFLIKIAIPIGVIVILIGAVMILISAGSEARVAAGRKILNSAVIGIIIVLAGWLVIDTVLTFFADPKVIPKAWYKIECRVEKPVSGGSSGTNSTSTAKSCPVVGDTKPNSKDVIESEEGFVVTCPVEEANSRIFDDFFDDWLDRVLAAGIEGFFNPTKEKALVVLGRNSNISRFYCHKGPNNILLDSLVKKKVPRVISVLSQSEVLNKTAAEDLASLIINTYDSLPYYYRTKQMRVHIAFVDGETTRQLCLQIGNNSQCRAGWYQPTGQRAIFINTGSESVNDEFEDVLAHELGHHFMWVQSGAGVPWEWENIFTRSQNCLLKSDDCDPYSSCGFPSQYASTDSKEDFAEMVALCAKKGGTLTGKGLSKTSPLLAEKIRYLRAVGACN